MLNCIYSGRRVCALDVKLKGGALNYELKKELKLAGLKDKLICDECGKPVILKAGEIKTPHFAHKKGEVFNTRMFHIEVKFYQELLI